MASPDYTTQKIKPIDGQLNFITPQDMPAKYNNTAAALSLTDDAVNLAIEVDRTNVIRTAEEKAELLSDTYKSQSPSEINYYENVAETARLKLNTDPDNPYWKESLLDAQNKLLNAKAQGKINAYEFQQRSQIEMQKIIDDNPAYASEILKTMENKYVQLGLKDVIDRDAELLKVSQESIAETRKNYVDFLIKHGNLTSGKNPYLLDNEELEAEFNLNFIKFSNMKKFERGATNIKNLNEKEVGDLKKEYLDNPESLASNIGMSINDFQYIAQDIHNSGLSLREKQNRLLVEYQRKERALSVLAGLGGSDTIFTTANKQLKEAYALALRVINNTDTEEALTSAININKLHNNAMLRTKSNPEQLEYDENSLKILELAVKINPDFKSGLNDTGYYNIIERYTSRVYDNGDRIFKDSSNELLMNTIFNPAFLNQFPKMNSMAEEQLKDKKIGKDLTPYTRSLYNNSFNVSSNITIPTRRARVSDKLLLNINKIPDNVFNNLLKDQDFQGSLNEELEFNRDVLVNDISQAWDGDMPPSVAFSSETGEFRANDFRNKEQKSLVTRLNNRLSLLNKMYPNTNFIKEFQEGKLPKPYRIFYRLTYKTPDEFNNKFNKESK